MINFARLEDVARAMEPICREGMRCFHCAFILKKGRVVSVGWNKAITHPKTKRYHYHHVAKLHAELASVIRGGREDYSGHTIAILRLDNNSKLNNSYPCNGCRHVIRQLGFDNCYFTDKDGGWQEIDPTQLHIETEPSRFK